MKRGEDERGGKIEVRVDSKCVVQTTGTLESILDLKPNVDVKRERSRKIEVKIN